MKLGQKVYTTTQPDVLDKKFKSVLIEVFTLRKSYPYVSKTDYFIKSFNAS